MHNNLEPKPEKDRFCGTPGDLEPVTVTLDARTLQAVNDAAVRQGVSRSFLVRTVLRKELGEGERS